MFWCLKIGGEFFDLCITYSIVYVYSIAFFIVVVTLINATIEFEFEFILLKALYLHTIYLNKQHNKVSH